MLISVTPANVDHFWVYPKLDNPPTPQNPQVVECLSSVLTNLKLKWFLLYYTTLKFSLQNYLWFLPSKSNFKLPVPGISRWFMMRCTFGSTWWMARCQKLQKPCFFFLPISGFEGFQRWSNMFFHQNFCRWFSFMNIDVSKSCLKVKKPPAICLEIIMVTLPGFDQTTSRTSYALLQTHWIRLSEMIKLIC